MLGYRGVLQRKRSHHLSYNRLVALCRAVGFPSPGYPSAPTFIAFIKQRLLEKSERLTVELNGLSAAGARDVVAAACYSINWERLTHAYGAILTPWHLEEEAWDIVSSLGAAIEPECTRRPLRSVEKFLVQQFARGIQGALGIEVPEAYELTARLYGFPGWTAAAGPRAPSFQMSRCTATASGLPPTACVDSLNRTQPRAQQRKISKQRLSDWPRTPGRKSRCNTWVSGTTCSQRLRLRVRLRSKRGGPVRYSSARVAPSEQYNPSFPVPSRRCRIRRPVISSGARY